MRVLVVNGFDPGDGAEIVASACGALRAAGHEPVVTDLAAEGFDRFLSAAERTAYHTDDPLVTPETRAAAGAVGAATGIVVCYRLVHGTCPPRVKSWQERVFVLGVGFRFQPSGRITGALDHLRRACVVAVTDVPEPAARRRNGQSRSFARSFHLSSNRRCRSRHLVVGSSDGAATVEAALRRW